MKHWLGDLRYRLHETNKQRKFACNMRSGVLRQEPRFRPIVRLGADIYAGYPPGSVEHAHVQRYEFAGRMVTGLVLNAAAGAGYGNEIMGRLGAAVIGVDLYDVPLKTARDHFPGHVFIRGDVTDMAFFKDSSFDAIVSFETIEHVNAPVKALAEFQRLLKPGGQLIGSIPIQIFHNPGTNFTYREATRFLRQHCPGNQTFLQTNSVILDDTPQAWRKIRMQGDKYLLFRWTKPRG